MTENLTHKQTRALEALLDSSTLSEAAERAGIDRVTLYRWMRSNLDFARAFKEAQERITLERIEAINEDRRRAAETIFSLMDDPDQPGGVRLRAAEIILNKADAAQQQAAEIVSRNVTANIDLDPLNVPLVFHRID